MIWKKMTTARVCHHSVATRDGDDPTKYCDHCAHELVADYEASTTKGTTITEFFDYLGSPECNHELKQRIIEMAKPQATQTVASRPHSDGIGDACPGCEDCNPMVDTPNSRRRPLAFESKEQAEEYSKQAGIQVWAKIWSWTGVFEIYPGGRSVWHKNW